MNPVFEPQLPADVTGVLKTAALLDATEFRVFELAYREWHGRDLDADQIEAHFVTYMFKGIVPIWVRQFTRKTLRYANRQGVSEDDLVEPDTATPSIAKGVRFLLAVVSILTFLFFVASSSDYLSSVTQECYFPPCY